ncbi:MAG: hypothetical protein K2W96_02010 [Gemmataceae bacterium]|nr:hypothetical protein [Gemmataceae bacterium]
MAIETSCPHYGKQYTLSDAQRGKKVACKGCGEPFTVESGGGRAGLAARRGDDEDDRPRRGRDDDDRDRDRDRDRYRDDDRSRRGRDRDEDDDRPRRRSRDDDEDDRPRRRPARRSGGGGAVLMWSLIGGGVALAVVVVLVFSGVFGNARVTKENFAKLNNGMTEPQAVAILGSGRDATAQAQREMGQFGGLQGDIFGRGKVKVLEWINGSNKIGGIFVDGKAVLFVAEFKEGSGTWRQTSGFGGIKF